MLQIRNKQAHNKGIRNENPINAKSVQLIELHAFAYCLLCVYLSALLNLLEMQTVIKQAICVNVLQMCCKTRANERKENLLSFSSAAEFDLGQIWK